jgi:hypothetical protein
MNVKREWKTGFEIHLIINTEKYKKEKYYFAQYIQQIQLQSNCLQRAYNLKVYNLTLSPPAVKTQLLSQCQAFQHLVRSFHSLVNWSFDLLNRFSISLACFWKHWMLFACVCNINTLGQWKESLGQTSESLCSSFSGRTNATTALSLLRQWKG